LFGASATAAGASGVRRILIEFSHLPLIPAQEPVKELAFSMTIGGQ
jgi:hypothetical protein